MFTCVILNHIQLMNFCTGSYDFMLSYGISLGAGFGSGDYLAL